MKKYKKHRDYGFFDRDIRLSKLSKLGYPLEKLNEKVDFEIFCEILEKDISKLLTRWIYIHKKSMNFYTFV